MTAVTPSPLAARFYEAAAPALRPAAAPGPESFRAGGPEAAPAEGPDLAAVARSFADTLREGERTALAGLAGKADAQSVVSALAASEIAVQTAVTLRDKVVEAYNEILRMPV